MAETKTQVTFNRSRRLRVIAYWSFTLPVAFENAAGAMWVLLPLIPKVNEMHAAVVFADFLRLMLAHLGYPQYFKYILGPWQLGCAAVLLAPRLPRAKEWAYIGAFFNYSSAFASHLFAGDRPDIGSAMMAVFVVLSWALRPPDRRLVSSGSAGETRAASWITSVAILALLLILSLFLVPSVPKP